MAKLLLFTACLLMMNTVQATNPTPAGLWKAYNDDGQPTGFIKISESQGVYTGVVEKGLPTDTEEKYCTLCEDDRKDQRLIGMTVLKNVQKNGDTFEGEEILDPFSGNTYRVKLTLKDAGKKMEVRGFVGFSLFGRTQIWEHAESGQ